MQLSLPRVSLPSVTTTKQALKAGFAIAVGYYVFTYARQPLEPHFIDSVNLVIHEAGHAVFMPFGKALFIAGGTIMQLIIPALFAAYFWWYQRDRYAVGLMLYWLGQNFVNVSVYARDAQVMQLPLLGGDPSGHDWHNLLDMFNLLPYTAAISDTIAVIGWIVMLAGFVLSVWYSLGLSWREAIRD